MKTSLSLFDKKKRGGGYPKLTNSVGVHFDERSFWFYSRLSSFLHVDDAKTTRTTKAHTSRVSGPQKREKKPTSTNFFGTRERERRLHSALSPHKKQNVISSHTHARIPFPVAAPPLEKDGRRFASATTCARNTRRLKSSSRAQSLLGAKVSKRRREEAI